MKAKILVLMLILFCLFIPMTAPGAMGADSDFVINEDNVLTGYTGTDAVITIPSRVVAIGGGAFYRNTYIVQVTIPDSVTAINGAAFQWCSNLVKINFPNNLKTISDNAFEGCSRLASITFPDGLTSIGAAAFKGCSSLISVTLPSSIATISANAFMDCSNLVSVVIPNSVNLIDSGAFRNCVKLSNVTMGTGVLTIGNFAFQACSSLQKITLPNGLLTIGQDTFRDCTKLQNFTIPSTVISIVDGAFRNCDALTSMTVPAGVTQISDWTFAECDALTKVVIPNGVISIGNYAFYNCPALTNVSLPASLTTIGEFAFRGCSFTNMTIPAGVQAVGANAFELCTKMTSVTIKGAIPAVSNGMFKACSSLTNVVLPKNLESIGNEAFDGCSRLATISIPDGVSSIGTAAFRNTAISDITLPSNLTAISAEMFNGAQIREIVIPDSVVSIGYRAFDGNPMQNITIPASVVSIIPTNLSYRATIPYNAVIWVYDLDDFASVWGTENNYTVKLIRPATSVDIKNSSGKSVKGKTVVLTSTDTFQLQAVALPEEALQNFKWKSSSPSTAAVDQTGLVTFKKEGKATIVATAADGSGKTANVTLIYVAPLEIKDTDVEGYMNDIRIKVPFDKNTAGFGVTVYDLNDTKISGITITTEVNAAGTYHIIHAKGSNLENTTIYKLKIYRYITINETNYKSAVVTKYGMPTKFVRGLTAAPENGGVTLNSYPLEGTEGTRYQIRDGQTGAAVQSKMITGSDKVWKVSNLENGHRYYVTARAYNKYSGHNVFGALLYKVYFIPLNAPGTTTITFPSSTTMKVSIPSDVAADGIRVLYRTPGGALQNGCEAKGTSCTIKNVSKTGKYELYVMKYKTSPSGQKHYSRGRLETYNTDASGLNAPTNPLVVVYGDTYRFSITKASSAKGISVLYRQGTSEFKLACEKASDTCQTTLADVGNYTFYIMQYKLNSAGKKVYSAGVIAKTRFSPKSADGAEFYEEEAEDFDTGVLYDVLEDYTSEADELMNEAYEVMGVDPMDDAEIVEVSAEESLMDLEDLTDEDPDDFEADYEVAVSDYDWDFEDQEDFDEEYDMYVPEDEWDLEDPEDFDAEYEIVVSDYDLGLEDPEDTDWDELIMEGLEDETVGKSVGSASGTTADPVSFYWLEDQTGDSKIPSFGK